VLEHDTLMGIKIANIDATGTTGILLEDHPADMGVPKALVDSIWVLIGINVTMMGAVIATPPAGRAFKSCCAPSEQNELNRERGVVGLVRPEAMVTSCDACTSENVLNDGEDEGFATKRDKVNTDK